MEALLAPRLPVNELQHCLQYYDRLVAPIGPKPQALKLVLESYWLLRP